MELMRHAGVIGGFGVGLHNILANVAFSICGNVESSSQETFRD
jgi:hypothetical protein